MRRQLVKHIEAEEDHQRRDDKVPQSIEQGMEIIHGEKPLVRHFRQHRSRHAYEDRTRSYAKQRNAFERYTPPIVGLGAPGPIGRANEGGETLKGNPNQDEKCYRACLLARCDHTGDGVKNVPLHLATHWHIAFHVGNDLLPGPIPVNKDRGNRDEEDDYRKQREEGMKGERSRPLSPVNPQKLFGGEHK